MMRAPGHKSGSLLLVLLHPFATLCDFILLHFVCLIAVKDRLRVFHSSKGHFVD